MLGQLAGAEGRPVGGGADGFAVGGLEVEKHGDLAFAEGGMLVEREAVLQFHLGFWRLLEVGNFRTAAIAPGDREW